jgi:hypothetical protein
LEILSGSFDIELMSFPVVLAAMDIGLHDTYNVVALLSIEAVFAIMG